MQADISREFGTTIRQVRAEAYRLSTTAARISRRPIRVEIGMREHRQQDSLDFHPFSFDHIHFNVVIELRASLKLNGDSDILDFTIMFALSFEIQLTYDFLDFIWLSLPKVIIKGILH